MARVVFFEKPGCVNNARQKALLRSLGHTLEVRDLLQEAWTPARLFAFFAERPMDEWINLVAPRVKSGEVIPAELSVEQLLALMVEDPLLIRRPLIETEAGRCCGFDDQPVLRALGLADGERADMQACPRQGQESPACPA